MNGTSGLRTAITATGFLLIAGFFLTTEHRAHLFGALPFLLLLACPLLHLFMHGGHGGHGRHGGHGGPRETAGTSSGDPHAGHRATPEDVP